jgi:glutamine amidotransferase-like uncharacterized protein
MRRSRLLVLATVLALAGARRVGGEPPAAPTSATLADLENNEKNLRWVLARERAATRPGVAHVGVVADLGAWHTGARSVVDALERSGLACRVLDRTLVTSEGLRGLEALVLPGGWAPLQSQSLGPAGLAAVRAFVEHGGCCLGICAGAYLLAREVRWEGATYPYPLGLFDGLAEGPIAGLTAWPSAGPTRLAPTEAGRRRGVGALAQHDVLYFGGPRLVGGSGVEVWATYPDGTPALVRRAVGKGEIVLCGAHVERPAVDGASDGTGMPAFAPELLHRLVAPAR